MGPTAVGKTGISIKVAQLLNAEILSCDSMQVYRGMDIGTAKAGVEERSVVPHHLIDMVAIDQDFSVAEYQKEAKKVIAEVNERGKLPLLVGGTGLYYQSVVDDYDFVPMESRREVRERLNKAAEQKGLPFLFKYLESLDPLYAAKISSNDQKRIIRALEVYELTGETFSVQQNKAENTYNLATVGLYLDREALYSRINMRVEQMFKDGLLEEVRALREQGYELDLNAMQALGYKQAYYYLEGFINWDDMADEIKRETRRYAKRQYTWFRKDKRIHWVNVDEYPNDNDLAQKISSFIGRTIL